jgi:hypothetical protein
MRTAVALMGFGIVIVKLRYLSPPAQRHGLGWKLGLEAGAGSWGWCSPLRAC